MIGPSTQPTAGQSACRDAIGLQAPHGIALGLTPSIRLTRSDSGNSQPCCWDNPNGNNGISSRYWRYIGEYGPRPSEDE